MLHSLRFRVPLVAVLAVGLIPATASAKSDPTVALHVQKGDRVTLTLSPKAKRTLSKRHVRLTARKPAARSKSRYSLPAKSGRWDFSTARGTVKLSGGLQVRVGRRTVHLSSLTFNRPAKGAGHVTTTLKGHRVTLFTVSGRAHVKRDGANETVTGLNVRLAKSGVKLIDKLLRHHSLGNRERVGSLSLTVSRATKAAKRGVDVTFAKEFESALGGASSILPISPSAGLPAPVGTTTIPGADGTEITLPLASGSATTGFNDGTLTGSLPLSGGVTLDDGSASATLTDPQLTLGTGTEGSSLSFSVDGGPDVNVLSLNTSTIESSATDNGSLDIKGLTATLSPEGAASLNTALGTDAFTTGEPVGGITVILPAQPSGS